MNLLVLYYFIAWLLFGIFVGVLARYTSVKTFVGLTISFILHLITYSTVGVLFVLLITNTPK